MAKKEEEAKKAEEAAAKAAAAKAKKEEEAEKKADKKADKKPDMKKLVNKGAPVTLHIEKKRFIIAHGVNMIESSEMAALEKAPLFKAMMKDEKFKMGSKPKK